MRIIKKTPPIWNHKNITQINQFSDYYKNRDSCGSVVQQVSIFDFCFDFKSKIDLQNVDTYSSIYDFT